MTDFKAEIEAAEKNYVDAVNSGNIDAILDCYHDDAKVLAPGSPMIAGRDAIKEYFIGLDGAGVARMECSVIDVGGEGNSAYLITNSKLFKADNSVFDDGKSLTLYYKEGGVWKILADAACTN